MFEIRAGGLGEVTQSKATVGSAESLSPKYSCVPPLLLAIQNINSVWQKKKKSRIQCSSEFLMLFWKSKITNSLKTLSLRVVEGVGDACAWPRSLSQPWSGQQLLRSHLPFLVIVALSDPE